MLTTPEITGTTTVELDGVSYPAESFAKGAAYQVFSATPRPGFNANPQVGLPFRRIVHATEVELIAGPAPATSDLPVRVPLSRSMSWAAAHRMTQSRSAADVAALRQMRDSVVIQRGTRMVKILSGRQLSGFLRGWLPMGFCHREYDIAHLRTPADLAVLSTDGRVDGSAPVIFALRWRAAGPEDYAIPYASDMAGLIGIPPHDRVGAPLLGTGFAPSNQHIIPEFVTADLADIPLPALAELVAFTADGAEVLLYRYLAEQRAWGRLAGSQWRHLWADVDGVVADQEYFPVPPAPSQLLGLVNGNPLEAVCDHPDGFMLLAKVRALRQPVSQPARRAPIAVWRDVRCLVVRDSDDWIRVRLIAPDSDAVSDLGATCVERGIYEAWAPVSEITDRSDQWTPYDS